MSTATDQTGITYPTQQELIGEPVAVAELQSERPREATSCFSPSIEASDPLSAPRRRHRWDLLGGSFVVGDETSTIQRLRCRHCGLQARRVPTRTGRGLRLEVLPDGDTDWTAEVAPCPGASEWRIPDDVTPEVSRIRKLEDQVEQLQAEAGAFLREIEIRGQLLDRLKVATGETWWHGAVEWVEQLQPVATAPQGGNYRSLVAGWHRKAQEVDHWQAKYERQLQHSRRVEAERDTLRASHDRLVQQVAELSQARPTRERRVPPAERRSTTKRFDVAGTHGYLTVGHYDDGTPCELFIVIAKEGSTIRGLLDGWARMFSIALQHGIPLAHLIEKAKGAHFEPAGWTDDPEITPVASILDYVVRWVERRYLPAPAADAEPALGAQP